METSQITLSFANVSGKKIEADFDGGTTTSDGGVLLLRQAEARTGIVNRLVGAMSDRRHQNYIDHTYPELFIKRRWPLVQVVVSPYVRVGHKQQPFGRTPRWKIRR